MNSSPQPRLAVQRMPSEFGIREGRSDFLRLDYNENTAGCSPAVRGALGRLTREGIATYPEYGPIRARLAKFFRVSPREMVLTNGADEALRLIGDAFLDRAQAMLLVEPTFTMYRIYAALFESRVVALRYDQQLGLPLAEVLQALAQNPRVFFLANPNNPTGTLVAKGALRQILEAAPRTLVAVDEAYFDFSGVTVLPWIRKYPNLVVIRTFSKACGMAGLRLGCLLANEELALHLRMAQPPFPVNVAALVAAQAAIRDPAFLRRFVREIQQSKSELERFLARKGCSVWSSHGNFLLADFGPGAPRILAALEKKRILLRDRTPDFGRPGWVRITIGTRAQTRQLTRALEKLL
jgi:histidinol-phosphate aminotransferase